MAGVETVDKSIAELQFGAQLEIRQIEVAAQTKFEEHVVTLQLYVVVVLARKVYHGVYSGHEIRTRVVESGGTEQQIECR